MWPVATHFVGWSVCLLDTTVSHAKTAKPTEVSFEMWPRVGPRNHALDGDADPPAFGGKTFDAAWCCNYCSLLLLMAKMYFWLNVDPCGLDELLLGGGVQIPMGRSMAMRPFA